MNKRGVLFFILIVFSLSQVMPIMPVFAALNAETGFECTNDNDCIIAGDRCSFSTRQCIHPVDKGTGKPGDPCIDAKDCTEKLVCLEDKCTEAKDVGGALTEYLTDLGEPAPVEEYNLTSALAKFGVLLVWALGAKLITYTLANLVEAIEGFTLLTVIPVGSIVSIAVGGVDNLMDSLLAVWFNMLLIGVAVSLILWFGLVLVGGLFALNCGVLASGVVGTGFRIILGLTNVGFVLVLVIIGFATILRLKGYAMKDALAKLIIAVLLINFSLFFIGLFLNVSNSITSAFLGREVCSINADLPAQNTGTSAGVAMDGPVEEFTLSYWKRFNLFSMRDTLGKITKENDPNVFIRVFVAPIFNLFFAAIISLIAAINIIFLIWALAVRYVTLSILIIFSPLVWLSFIFPKLGGDLGNLWKEWWSTFIKWIIFLPVFSFFLYLVKILLESSFDNPTELYSQGFLAFMGKLIVILVLLFGGLFAAKKMGIAGADKAFAIAGAMTPAVLGSAARMTARKIAAGASARWARRPTRPTSTPSGGTTPPPPTPSGGGRGGRRGGWSRTYWRHGPPPPTGSTIPPGTPDSGEWSRTSWQEGPPSGSTPSEPNPETFTSSRYGDTELGFPYFEPEDYGEPSSSANPKEEGGPVPETFANSRYREAELGFPYFEPEEDSNESPSPAGSEGEGGPGPDQGTPSGGSPVPSPSKEEGEWSQASWQDTSPTPSGGRDTPPTPSDVTPPPPAPSGSGSGSGEGWSEAHWWESTPGGATPPASGGVPVPAPSKSRWEKVKKFYQAYPQSVRSGMFDASIFKAVLSAAGAKPKEDTGGKEEKEIKRLKDLEKNQKEKIERLEAEERNRANGAS